VSRRESSACAASASASRRSASIVRITHSARGSASVSASGPVIRWRIRIYYDYPHSYGYPYPAAPYVMAIRLRMDMRLRHMGILRQASRPDIRRRAIQRRATLLTARPRSATRRSSPQEPPAHSPAGSSLDTGGVSFEITPNTAAVFVDGTYVGTIAEFGPESQPLASSRDAITSKSVRPGIRRCRSTRT
jgi:hypothetical protein